MMLRVPRILTRSALPVRYLLGGAKALPLPNESASVVSRANSARIFSVAILKRCPSIRPAS